MRHLLSDVAFGLRLLNRGKGFASVAILTLALGIGANSAIFTVIDAVLLRPLPYPEADRLAFVYEEASYLSFPKNTPAPANYADWRARNRTFLDMAALRFQSANLAGGGSPEFVIGAGATGNFFSVLGVGATLGRVFTPEEDRPASTLVVISHGLWQRRFGGDPSIAGRTIHLSGEPHTVIGIMPEGFHFPRRNIDFWTPAGFTAAELNKRSHHYLTVVGRLKPGVTMVQAQADLTSIANQLKREYPDTNAQVGVTVGPLRGELVGNTRLALLVLLGASIAVLLIGCANLANMLLARSSVRAREVAVRTALGAGQGRLLAQFLTESLTLSALGGLGGLLLARLSLRLLEHLVPDEMVSYTSLGVDPRMLLFTLAVSLLTGLIFGTAPAWQSARLPLNEALKRGGRSDASTGGERFRNALVIAEVALAVVLVVGAGLLIQTLVHLRSLDLGFRPERLLTMVTVLPDKKYPQPAQRQQFHQRVLDEVRQLPGVVEAAFSSNPPLAASGNTFSYVIEGQPPSQDNDALYRSGSPTYLRTIGARLKQGRFYDERDTRAAAPVIVVNETFVRRHFPDGNPLGHRIAWSLDKPNWMTIVGVVEDINERGLELDMKPAVYVPDAQQGWEAEFLVVRTASEPHALINAIRGRIWSVDREQPVFRPMTIEDAAESMLAGRKRETRLLFAFSALALLLAATGLYGVLTYAVSRRTREIGLRMALGATQSNVLAMIMSRGFSMTALGLLLGGAASLLLASSIKALLFGVDATDPRVFAITGAVLLVVAALACFIPARRAARLDPMTALREE